MLTRNSARKENSMNDNCAFEDVTVVNNTVSPDLNNNFDALDSEDVKSQISVCQSLSSNANMARLKLAKAQLVKRNLEERLKLETKLKVMEAEQEVELAQLECALFDEDEVGLGPPLPCVIDKVVESVKHDVHAHNVDTSVVNDVHLNFVNDLKSSLSNIIHCGSMPRLEMLHFEGHPRMYWNFVRQFDSMVGSRIDDKGQLLSYLLHYCKGKAKIAIEACVTLPIEEGYDKARRILHELFGQEHMIARSYIDELVRSNRQIGSSAEELTEFAVKLTNGQMTLSQMGYIADLDSPINLERIISRLSYELQGKWVEVADRIQLSGREPVFKDLTDFIASRARIARTRYGMLLRHNLDIKGPSKTQSRDSTPKRSYFNVMKCDETPRTFDRQNVQPICNVCGLRHHLPSCTEFSQMNVTDRRYKAKELGLCYLCLKTGHAARVCRSGFRCTIDGCNVRHHPLLHIAEIWSDTNPEAAVNHVHTETRSGVYFGVVPVRLSGPLGVAETYAFLDSGSDTSLVSNKLVEKLGLDGKQSTLNMVTLNGSSNHTCVEVNLELFSLDGNSSVTIPRAYSVSELPLGKVCIPKAEDLDRWKHLRDIKMPLLADNTVSILIGCEVPDAHWTLEQRLGDRKQPFAVRTHLGWMVMGPANHRDYRQVMCCCGTQQCELVAHYEKLYEREFSDLDSFRKELSVEDKQALALANDTVRFVDGHFEVGLPWKHANPRLPDNISMANRRLECLRKRLLKDDELLERYNGVMEDHLRKGYIVEVGESHPLNNNTLKWYIPHHPVFNPKKPGKLRVVFDCAASYRGTSLNEQLLQGPNMINSLVGVLLRFRSEPVAIAADIEEMFLQVNVPTVDRGALRLLWWKNGNIHHSPTEYQLSVHPFGAVSSPFCADFALRKAIQEFGSGAIETVHSAVDKHFYVDDCLIAVCNEHKAIQIIEQLSSVLRKGGFRLTKWVSNNLDVLSTVPQEERASTMRDLDFEKLNIERTLGLCWDTNRDAFVFKVSLQTKPITRRGLLSTVASLYDPLGLVAPFILPAKQLLQRLCKEGLGWDEQITENESRVWYRWLDTVQQLTDVVFPRCIRTMTGNQEVHLQLHLFCDASEVGYGAVAYVRSHAHDVGTTCSLVMAKARVAPLKLQTIPRLELTAATLAARLGDLLQTELQLEFDDVFYWTDSTVVLYYINNTNDRYRTFVANRLTTIHKISRPAQWKYVPSETNVADWVSRGLDHIDHRLTTWIKGPEFLSEAENTWPKTNLSTDCRNSDLELKKVALINTLTRSTDSHKLLEYHSDWIRLLKSVVWLDRFKYYLMIKFGGRVDVTLQVGLIKTHEMDRACTLVVGLVQAMEFETEMKLLSSDRGSLPLRGVDSKLRKLNPIIIDNILRVGGRLQNSNHPERSKNPMILPSKHHITDLIIRHYHVIEGHVGATQLLATLRERFWILRGGLAVRRVINKCIECRRSSPRMAKQIMAPLPSARVNAEDHPFTSVGVDFFGPILVKRGRCREKRYGCIFTCLKIRAIHLEVTHSLSTDSFLMALMRFIGRRGHPTDIFSDNGSNLIGAKNELKECLGSWSQERIHNHLLRHGIRWHFNPPLASHWGGVWERMIRSVRKVLSTLSKEQTMSDESLLTFMVEAERVVNNRPLTPLTNDPNDLGVLTPSKLLLLRDNVESLGGLDHSSQYVRRWRKANYLAEIFWKRWVKEYVLTLQQRQKWLKKERNFEIGDLVIVASDMNIRNRWPLGLISRVFASSDNLVRQVEVKTAHGYLTRDIRKLCLLEAADGT